MVNPDKIFGRLSNRMFLMAAWYTHAKDNNIPFFAQDEKYFEKYKDEIKALYSDGITPNGINAVGIHVRRAKNPINPEEPAYSENGFYADLGHHLHEDMSDNYYVRAMAMFPGEKFIVFSDDPEWCEKQAIFEGCTIARGNEIEDMNNLASCRGIIGANSSFSWWAAYLSSAVRIVFPKRWFANEENESLIGLPKHWLRI